MLRLRLVLFAVAVASRCFSVTPIRVVPDVDAATERPEVGFFGRVMRATTPAGRVTLSRLINDFDVAPELPEFDFVRTAWRLGESPRPTPSRWPRCSGD